MVETLVIVAFGLVILGIVAARWRRNRLARESPAAGVHEIPDGSKPLDDRSTG